MIYSFEKANAEDTRKVQYFELLGNRGIYKDGWMASTIPGNPSWEAAGKVDPNTFQWALYDLNTDWSQSKDVSARYPGKLAELKADFEAAAKKYNIYPLDADLVLRMGPGRRPSLVGGRTSFTYYPGDTRYTGTAFPALAPGWTISAAVTTGPGRSDGTILVQGDHFGGQGLLIRGGVPTYVLNPGDMRQVVLVRAAQPLAPGRHLIEVAFIPAASPGAGTTIDLRVDGKSVGSAQTRAAVRGRGDAYVGRPGIAPLLDGPEWASLPPACECDIDHVTIQRNADAR
jgi:arylsulfatase